MDRPDSNGIKWWDSIWAGHCIEFSNLGTSGNRNLVWTSLGSERRTLRNVTKGAGRIEGIDFGSVSFGPATSGGLWHDPARGEPMWQLMS